MKTSGQIAYEAYYVSRYGQELLSHVQIPRFKDQSLAVQDAWEVCGRGGDQEFARGVMRLRSAIVFLYFVLSVSCAAKHRHHRHKIHVTPAEIDHYIDGQCYSWQGAKCTVHVT